MVAQEALQVQRKEADERLALANQVCVVVRTSCDALEFFVLACRAVRRHALSQSCATR